MRKGDRGLGDFFPQGPDLVFLSDPLMRMGSSEAAQAEPHCQLGSSPALMSLCFVLETSQDVGFISFSFSCI